MQIKARSITYLEDGGRTCVPNSYRVGWGRSSTWLNPWRSNVRSCLNSMVGSSEIIQTRSLSGVSVEVEQEDYLLEGTLRRYGGRAYISPAPFLWSWRCLPYAPLTSDLPHSSTWKKTLGNWTHAFNAPTAKIIPSCSWRAQGHGDVPDPTLGALRGKGSPLKEASDAWRFLFPPCVQQLQLERSPSWGSRSHMLGKHIGIAAEEVAIPGCPASAREREDVGAELKKPVESPRLWGSQREAEQAPVPPMSVPGRDSW